MKVPRPKAATDSVGVRDLKASLSGYLRRVREGESLTVTDHGEPIARIIPAGMPAGLERLMGQSWFKWSGRKPELVDPPLKLTPGPSASDMVIQMRQERDDIIFQAAVQPASPKRPRGVRR